MKRWGSPYFPPFAKTLVTYVKKFSNVNGKKFFQAENCLNFETKLVMSRTDESKILSGFHKVCFQMKKAPIFTVNDFLHSSVKLKMFNLIFIQFNVLKNSLVL